MSQKSTLKSVIALLRSRLPSSANISNTSSSRGRWPTMTRKLRLWPRTPSTSLMTSEKTSTKSWTTPSPCNPRSTCKPPSATPNRSRRRAYQVSTGVLNNPTISHHHQTKTLSRFKVAQEASLSTKSGVPIAARRDSNHPNARTTTLATSTLKLSLSVTWTTTSFQRATRRPRWSILILSSSRGKRVQFCWRSPKFKTLWLNRWPCLASHHKAPFTSLRCPLPASRVM